MHIQIFRDSEGYYSWQLRFPNNTVAAHSHEGYKTKREVMRVVRKVAEALVGLDELPIIERLN